MERARNKFASLFAQWHQSCSNCARQTRSYATRHERLSAGRNGEGADYTKAEDETIVQLRNERKTFREISELMPGRTLASVATRYYKLEPSFFTHPRLEPWTAEEDDTLRELKRAGRTTREISARLSNRSEAQVSRRYYKQLRPEVGIHIRPSPRWTGAELKRLHELGETDAAWDDIATQFPSRTKRALQHMWRDRFGSPRTNSGVPHAPGSRVMQKKPQRSSGQAWTELEDQALLDLRNVHKRSWAQVAESLPERSLFAVKDRYLQLDTSTPWVYNSHLNMTEEEARKALELHANGLDWKGIKENMGERWTESSLYSRSRAAQHFPHRLPARRKWTAEEDERLMRLWREDEGKLTRMEEVTGRTLRSCQARLRLLKSTEQKEKKNEAKDRKTENETEAVE